MTARRAVLAGTAVAFFLWEIGATALWLRDQGSLGPALRHAWAAATADWMALVFFTDMLVFTLCALAWMVADLRARGMHGGCTAAWLGAAIVLGSPVLLIYLASRPPGASGNPAPSK